MARHVHSSERNKGIAARRATDERNKRGPHRMGSAKKTTAPLPSTNGARVEGEDPKENMTIRVMRTFRLGVQDPRSRAHAFYAPLCSTASGPRCKEGGGRRGSPGKRRVVSKGTDESAPVGPQQGPSLRERVSGRGLGSL
ncbi:hypothetical protein MTO96_025755 [Rhipicephalus appendiculatus]